jgi:hypothetical protein
MMQRVQILIFTFHSLLSEPQAHVLRLTTITLVRLAAATQVFGKISQAVPEMPVGDAVQFKAADSSA